jgi:hypothetical protein
MCACSIHFTTAFFHLLISEIGVVKSRSEEKTQEEGARAEAQDARGEDITNAPTRFGLAKWVFLAESGIDTKSSGSIASCRVRREDSRMPTVKGRRLVPQPLIAQLDRGRHQQKIVVT